MRLKILEHAINVFEAACFGGSRIFNVPMNLFVDKPCFHGLDKRIVAFTYETTHGKVFIIR